MIDRDHPDHPVGRQYTLLHLPRSTFYHEADPVSDSDLAIMALIDCCHLERPFCSSRRIRGWLADQGHQVIRKRLQRLMRKIAIAALYSKRNLSLANQAHKVHPYTPHDLTNDRPNQVWSTDMTYSPMACGFVFLIAAIDWYSRKVLSWRVSNTLDTHLFVEPLEDAIETYGCPEVFNTDQGNQFTSTYVTDVLKATHIQISMDSKGRWVDNVFVKHRWRSVSHDAVYLKTYDDALSAKRSLEEHFRFYNSERRHQRLGEQTPDRVYNQTAARLAA